VLDFGTSPRPSARRASTRLAAAALAEPSFSKLRAERGLLIRGEAMDVTSEEVANHLLDRSPHWNTSTRLTKELDWDDVHRREALIAAIVGAPALGLFWAGVIQMFYLQRAAIDERIVKLHISR
jgi:hypothetical protein